MKKESFDAIARALNDAGVPFLVVDGLAVNAHGYGRVTFDVDVVIRLTPDSIRNAFRALAAIGYHPAVPITAEQFGDADLRNSLRQAKDMAVLKFWSDTHRETPLDVFVTEPFPFDEEYSGAYIQESAPGLPVRIVCFDTLIRMKQAAARPQDLADISELRFIRNGRYEP
jgi:hypothetical protein